MRRDLGKELQPGKWAGSPPYEQALSLAQFLYFLQTANDTKYSNSKMKQGITKLQTTSFIIQKYYSFASIKIFDSDLA